MLLATIACAGEQNATLVASGTIEIVQSDVAALVPARITHVLVNDGDSVKAGDTLVRLTQSTLASDIEMRRARVAAVAASLRDLEAGARPGEIGKAEAELRTADSEVERTTKDLERAAAMLQAQAISQAQYDMAKSAAATAKGRRDVIAETLALIKAGTRDERIRAARAELDGARAALNAALAMSSDLVLTAPVSGTVLSRYVETGEVIAPGVPTLTIGDVQQPWVRVFVAAPALTRLRVGQEALAQLQGADDQLFSGRIVAIDAQAQFTPRIALTKEERADLMFGVKVQLAQHDGMLKPGLPVDVHFGTTGAGFPAALTDGKTVHKAAAPNGGR